MKKKSLSAKFIISLLVMILMFSLVTACKPKPVEPVDDDDITNVDDPVEDDNTNLVEPYNPYWTSIEISGDELFVKNTTKALDLIKEKAPDKYEILLRYVGVIKQGEYSGMYAYYDPPTFQVGDPTSQSSTTWYASSIVHDSYHSKLYNDYREANGSVPGDVWTGEEAEMKCLEYQIEFLEEIGAPKDEIEYAKSLRGTNWWDIPRDW